MFVFLFIAHCFMDFMEANRKIEEIEEKIYSIGLEHNSAFVLGRQGQEYIYYSGDSIAGFKLESVPARKAIVKYTSEKPYVKKRFTQSGDCVFVVSAIFYLPNNSIVQGYQISLDNK